MPGKGPLRPLAAAAGYMAVKETGETSETHLIAILDRRVQETRRQM